MFSPRVAQYIWQKKKYSFAARKVEFQIHDHTCTLLFYSNVALKVSLNGIKFQKKKLFSQQCLKKMVIKKCQKDYTIGFPTY